MSVRTLAAVWERSRHAGTELLMLLAIADFSDDDGRAYPSVATLARKTRMKPRNANYLLSALRASGELSVLPGQGPKGANVYRVNLKQLFAAPAADCTPATSCTPPLHGGARAPAEDCSAGLQGVAAKPSETRQGTRERGTPFALDSLPDEWRQTAKELRPELDPDEQFLKFGDYWRSTGKVRVDWDATWRLWLLREKASREGSSAAAVPWWKSRKATLAKGAKHGLRPEDYVDELGREDTRAYLAAVMQAEGVRADAGSAA